MMTPKRIAIAAALLTLILISALWLYPLANQAWQAPLGERISLPEPQASPTLPTGTPITRLPGPEATASAVPETTETVLITPDTSPTPAPQPLCGGPEVLYILGIGADSRSDTYLYGLSDVMRVARVDFITPKITMLTIPRDLWVEIPGISDHYGITHGKLNQAYLYGGPGMGYYDGPGEGAGLLARTLDKNFNLRVERYGAVNMLTFVRIVDALGGIDIYLEEDMDGRPVDDITDDMGYFYAGQQHLTGEAALRLSRIRKNYTVFKRQDNQTLVMCALREKLLSPAVLPKIPELVAAFVDSVRTDLSPEEISQLACLLPRVSKENLIFTSFPQELFVQSRMYDPVYKINTFVWDVDFEVLRQYVAEFQQGNWPNQPKEPSCP